jgi:drug/metabolite transporter (DMT)-like permease
MSIVMELHKVNTVLARFYKIKSANTMGFAVAIIAAALSSLPDVITKPIIDPTVAGVVPTDPLFVVFIMYMMTGIVFTPISKLQKPKTRVKKSSYLVLIIYGIASAFSTLAFSYGLKETSATNASILANSEIVFTVLIGMIMYKEYLAKKEILPFVLIAAGAIFMPIASDVYEHKFEFTKFVFGDAMVLLSGFIYCICTFIAKHAGTVNTAKVVQVMSLSGAGICFALMMATDASFAITSSDLTLLSFIGVAGIGGSVLFFVLAVRLIGAVRTILVYSSSTAFGIVYSGAYLLEAINPFTVSSIVIVAVGLYRLRFKLAA